MKQDKYKITDFSMNEYYAFCLVELKDVRINQHEYQQVIESFMYVAIYIHFNIIFTFNQLN